MEKKYIIIARDKICTPNPDTDDTLRALDCYYQSPVFLSDGTEKSLEAALDKYQAYFEHFKYPTIEFVEVK